VFPNLNPAITILIALLPAMLALALGRGLSRHLDDPLLPERLFAIRRRTGPLFGVAIGLLLATSPARYFWAIPLMAIARMAAAYPFRKTLHGETWSFGAYLSFFTRLVVAVFGLWTLLATIPFAAMAAGSWDWVVGVPLAAIVVVWHRKYSAVFRWMLRSRPVKDGEVVSRFERMVKACGLPAVSLEEVEMHGGSFANGVALPSIRRPAVVVTETLIARLDRDETVAILAHELAHLEFYNPSRLRRNNAIVDALAVMAALWHTLFRVMTPETLWAAPLFWPVLLFGVGVLRAQHRQKHETESDLRAAELTGDPDAVVRALTKLHVFARLPRRWDTELERHATHPSLARRIQAIRAAGGTVHTSQMTLGEPVVFSAPKGGASVTFHEDQLEWGEAGSTIRTLEYAQLAELRIRAHAFGKPRLVAMDSTRRLEMALAPNDIARMQSVLDIVDTRLAKAEAPAVVPFRIRRVLSLLAIFAGMSVGQMSVLITGLLELVRPAPQMAAALGASALGAAVLRWHDGGAWYNPFWILLTLLLSGAALIGVAVANRGEAPRKITPRLMAVLAGCSVFMWALVLMHGVNALELHRSAREWPGVFILTLAMAGALALSPSPRMRWVAAPVALTALFAGFLRLDTFADRFVKDSFVSPASALSVTAVTDAPVGEFVVEFPVSQTWISKNGSFVAFHEGYDDDEDSTIRAGKPGGPFAEIDASDAMFLDDARLLVLKRGNRICRLRVIDLNGDPGENKRDTWSIDVPVTWPALSIDRESERWRLLGRDSETARCRSGIGKFFRKTRRWRSRCRTALRLCGRAASLLNCRSHGFPIFSRSLPAPNPGSGGWTATGARRCWIPIPRSIASRAA